MHQIKRRTSLVDLKKCYQVKKEDIRLATQVYLRKKVIYDVNLRLEMVIDEVVLLKQTSLSMFCSDEPLT